MIRSMTGYGKAECHLPDKKLTIEIRSLNSKQMDSSVRLPSLYKEKELEIRQRIASSLERGKVECVFYYESNGETPAGSINVAAVKNYYEQLCRIADELGLSSSSDLLSTVMRMPETIKSEKASLEEEEWARVEDALKAAIAQVVDFRTQEGRSLEADLRERVREIENRLTRIEAYEAERIGKIRERIGNNLASWIGKDKIDENRFEQELIFYIEKLDISEEKVRLTNHCRYFLETLTIGEAAGKKLGFIAQEMGREINTLGSKANHAEIQRLVVEMKDELERIKEQILNTL
ncbi:MAG: YicC family protein [Bacteroidetes bacterium]|nr:MAG: YicC family protein [Bacteroidota bacterium]